VALEGVRDPGNLGTILRSATAAGAAGVIQLGGGCDPYAPESVRASMGTIFAQRLVRAELSEFEVWCRARGLSVIAAEPRGGGDFQAQDYRLPAVLLMGSEGEGLSEAALALADLRVTIPMRPEAESLNLAVSTALVLYAVAGRCGLADPD
jgi:TrmH family RNA methyltransferase